MRTTADEKCQVAHDSVVAALLALNEVVVVRVYGWSDYTDEHKQDLKDAYLHLMKVREMLAIYGDE